MDRRPNTVRITSERSLRQSRHETGGTEHRPMRTGCNLHKDLQLRGPSGPRESPWSDQRRPIDRANPRGTPRAESVFPYFAHQVVGLESINSGFAAAPNFRPATGSAVMAPSFFSSRTSSL